MPCLLLLSDIDATGIHFLSDFLDELYDDSIGLVLANPNNRVSAGSHPFMWLGLLNASITCTTNSD